MSKQSQANDIVAQSKAAGLDRQTCIDEISAQTACSQAYAATLYRNANKVHATSGAAAPDGSMAKFTNANMDTIRAEAQAALDAISAAHGITLKMGNIRYDPDRLSFTSKIEANIGSKADKAKNEWDKYCSMYGGKPGDFGRQFKTRHGNCTIIGINPRAKKYPIDAQAPDGSKYGFEARVLEKLL